MLFDEIEKAHPDVLNILLQILDDGKVTDSHGKEVDFSSSIIVMTTNAGSNTGTGAVGFGASEKAIAENKTERALSEFLRPEFMNRVDEIITFRHLDKEDFRRIAANMIDDLRKALAEKGIAVTCTEEALSLIAEKSFSVKYGARNMRRFISRNIEDIAAEKMISAYDKNVKEIYIFANGEDICVDII